MFWPDHFCQTSIDIKKAFASPTSDYGFKLILHSIEMFREKLARLDRIREKLVSQMTEKVDDETERINKAKEEVESKTLREEEEKENKRAAALRSINEHRLEDVS